MSQSSRSTALLVLLAAATVAGAAGCHVHVADRRPHQAAPPTTEPLVIATVERAPIEGLWTDGELTLEIRREGDALRVLYPNGRGPFTGRFIGEDQIQVDFYDDSPCCTARYDGERIHWSNGGSWRRPSSGDTKVELGWRTEASWSWP
jgi:hypothetical protein